MKIDINRKIFGSAFRLLAVLVAVVGFYLFYRYSQPNYFAMSMGAFFLLYDIAGLVSEEFYVKGFIVIKSENIKKYYTIATISAIASVILFAIAIL